MPRGANAAGPPRSRSRARAPWTPPANGPSLPGQVRTRRPGLRSSRRRRTAQPRPPTARPRHGSIHCDRASSWDVILPPSAPLDFLLECIGFPPTVGVEDLLAVIDDRGGGRVERRTGGPPAAEARRRAGGARRSRSRPGLLDGDTAAARPDAQAPRHHRDRPHRRVSLRRPPRRLVRAADAGRAARGRSSRPLSPRHLDHGRPAPRRTRPAGQGPRGLRRGVRRPRGPDRPERRGQSAGCARAALRGDDRPPRGPRGPRGLLRRLPPDPHDPAHGQPGDRRTRRDRGLRRPGPAHRPDAQPLAAGAGRASASPAGLADRGPSSSRAGSPVASRGAAGRASAEPGRPFGASI